MTVYLPVVDVAICAERLELIFPKTAFDAALSNPGAAASAAAMLYLGAVWDDATTSPDQRWLRPSMVMWLNDGDFEHDTIDEREAWYDAARRGKKFVIELLASRGETFDPRYSDNTREGPRDETWPQWREFGAIIYRTDVSTTYPGPRWILSRDFAALFDPRLEGDQLRAAADAWAEAHLSTAGRMRALSARELSRREHAVTVTLPSGERRLLEPGGASHILKGVIEEWAKRKLREPMVLSVSEPGDKVYLVDAARLASVGLRIDPSRVLPDALLVDVGATPIQYWIVEAVFSDGEINERRKADLLAWAVEQGIDPLECRFLTAFASRNSMPARKRLKDLAAETSAWFLDEPDFELQWTRMEPMQLAELAPVIPIRKANE
ncbi:BsuBI/PstI family type II restriction endonuclease [Salinibacterium hongtaonis]|uniref:BsuBI/PstI family type II restriction endonuclease n=1 Tax=Homoserinimonas hongtaonis TaxID=2079791 RepID=UPI000D373985|nr:BsuBI/PstI family type II restriction endonuclease [Salinibacterium hongtaonis]AWB88748.1 restriction endonuclease [Salinibacterium hongtaonis]